VIDPGYDSNNFFDRQELVQLQRNVCDTGRGVTRDCNIFGRLLFGVLIFIVPDLAGRHEVPMVVDHELKTVTVMPSQMGVQHTFGFNARVTMENRDRRLQQ
jgi:hypothetical protein